ncbi:acylphosphatase-1-like [Lethenteron reissneri]|uniref:acylphosphatase-1-like n=1 Tax=Lethenteron reissneri TaxID=7753 RepID=UPI002AB746FF|nr:acylphosphatase-1-like [Lethenteron reissneri]
MANAAALASMDFEVFGKVQGVFFRKHTRQEAMRLGLVGWVRNTERHTVEGRAQGPPDRTEQLKVWLSTKGSPKSRITRAEFSSERTVEKAEYSDFRVVK